MKRYIVVLLAIALLFPLAGDASQQRLRTIVSLEDFAYDYNFAIKTFRGAKRDLLFYPNLHTVENSGPMDLMVIQIEDGKAQIFLQFPAGKKDIITVAFVTLLENLSRKILAQRIISAQSCMPVNFRRKSLMRNSARSKASER